VSAHIGAMLGIVIVCPRNLHTPSSPDTPWKYDSGREKPEVPGAKRDGGIARPVGDRSELSEVNSSGTVSVWSAELIDVK